MNTIIVFVLALLGIAAFYLIRRFLKDRRDKQNRDFIENKEHELYSITEAELYLFSVDWCPHCKDTKVIWDRFTSTYTSDKYQITFVEVDCDERENLAKEFNVEEYPTIVMVKDDKKYYYDANIKKETLEKFIDTIMKL
jgi:thioredoxin-like negative regulator of GroEL